jgi:hypothetical protein
MKMTNSIMATILGLLVAIANAWINIDWEHFEFTTGNCIKLLLSAIIAISGLVSTIKPVNSKSKYKNII